MYLLDTSVVSELRRLDPHPTVARRVRQVNVEGLLLSAVTAGEIRADIELTRERDIAKAEELEAWLGAVLISQNILPLSASTSRGPVRRPGAPVDAQRGVCRTERLERPAGQSPQPEPTSTMTSCATSASSVTRIMPDANGPGRRDIHSSKRVGPGRRA